MLILLHNKPNMYKIISYTHVNSNHLQGVKVSYTYFTFLHQTMNPDSH
jgi:hypothetical protein